MAITAKAITCACHDQSTRSEMAPTASAARPSQNMKTPGAITSTTSSRPPTMNQFQMPRDDSADHMAAYPWPSGRGGSLNGLGEAAAVAGPVGPVGRGGDGGRGGDAGRSSPKVALAISAMPASEPSTPMVSIGSISIFWFGACARAGERLEIFLGDEVVERRHLAAGDRLADHLGRACASAWARRSRPSASRKAASRRPSASRICDCFGALGAQDRRLALAFGGEDLGALLALRLHLPAHGLDQVGGRHDVLDLDAVDLDAPGRDGGIDDAQEPLVDLVAVRQHLVEIHGAHHRADIGHGQRDDRLLELDTS